MNLILLGPPGSGKGTQAKLLAKHFKINHISSGELLRRAAKENTQKAILIKKIMNSGDLVPFDTVLDVILDEINTSQTGFILDGTPRDLPQAEHMDWFFTQKNVKIDHVLYYNLSDKESLKRLSNRAKIEGRSDDKPEIHQERLRIYHQETEPVIAYYKQQNKLITIDAQPSVEQIFTNTIKILDQSVK